MKLANHILVITLTISFVATPLAHAAHHTLDFSKANARKTDAIERQETPFITSDMLHYMIGSVAVALTTGTIWYIMARRPIANAQPAAPLAQGAAAAAMALVGGPHVANPPLPPPSMPLSRSHVRPEASQIAALKNRFEAPRPHDHQEISQQPLTPRGAPPLIARLPIRDDSDFSSDKEESAKPMRREEMPKFRAEPIQQAASSEFKKPKKLDMTRFGNIASVLAMPQQSPQEPKPRSETTASLQKEKIVAAASLFAKGGGVKIDMSAFKNMGPPPAIPVFPNTEVGETPVVDLALQAPNVPFEGPPVAPPPPPHVAKGQGVVAAFSAEALRGVKLIKNGGIQLGPKFSHKAPPPKDDYLALLKAKFETRLKATSGLTPEESRWQTALRRATLIEIGEDNPTVHISSFTVSLIHLIQQGSPQFDQSLANMLTPDLQLGKFQRYTLLLGLLKGFLMCKVPVEAADETNFLKSIEEIFHEDPRLFEKYGDLLKQVD